VSGPYVEQTEAATEVGTQEQVQRGLFEESIRGVLMLYVGDGEWFDSLVHDIVSDPHLAALVAAAEGRGARAERERILKTLSEHEAELQRVRTPDDDLDGGRIAGVQEAAYIVRAREWATS